MPPFSSPSEKTSKEDNKRLLKETVKFISKAGKGIIVASDASLEVVVAIAAKETTLNVAKTAKIRSPTDNMGIGIPEGVEYRKKKLSYAQELQFDRLYVTKTGKPTAIFKPVDDREWNHIELPLSEVDYVFPTFSDELAGVISTKITMDRTMTEVSFPDLYNRVVKAMKAKVEDEKRLEQEAAEALLHENPEWGAF